MTSHQLAEAQKRAREMVEANPKLMGEKVVRTCQIVRG